MKNINFTKQQALSYTQVFLNEKEIKGVASYHFILQSKLALVNDLVSEGFSNMINFSHDYLKEHKDIEKYALLRLSDIAMEYLVILKRGVPLLNSLSNQLEEKEISKEAFEVLLHIINYQLDITKEIVNKELTMERIDVVFNHLRDIPYYLQIDLELDNLPKLKAVSEKNINKSKRSGWRIVKQGYNPEDKDKYIA